MAVYFIQAGESGGPIKIGYAKNPLGRLRELQTGCHETLYLLAVISGGRLDEADLHRRYEYARHRGEWFWPAPSLTKLIKDYRASSDASVCGSASLKNCPSCGGEGFDAALPLNDFCRTCVGIGAVPAGGE